MDIFTLMLDDFFYRNGIRFVPTQERILSRDIKIANVDNSILKTNYWADSLLFNNERHLAYKPVRMLIGIRKYLAMKSCGAYEKIKIRGKG